MKDENKSKHQLIDELTEARRLIDDLEHSVLEHERMEKILHDRETALLATVMSVRDAIIIINGQGKISFWNPAAEKILGYDQTEALGRDLHPLLAPERYQKDYREGILNFIHTGQGKAVDKTLELSAIRKDGTEMPIELSLSAVQLKEEWHAVGIIRDITGRKKAEEAIRQGEEKYRTILETIPDVYFEADLDGNLTFFNDQISLLSGYSTEETLGRNYRFFTDKESARKVSEAFNKVYTTGTIAKGVDWEITRKDGTKRHIEQSVSLIHDSSGKLTGFRGIIRDVTERKLAALEKERLIGELQQALTDIKTLSGLLPICSHCKKIRDDKGYWNQLESYISEHSDALFSHGICPDCLKKYYPDMYTEEDKKAK